MGQRVPQRRRIRRPCRAGRVVRQAARHHGGARVHATLRRAGARGRAVQPRQPPQLPGGRAAVRFRHDQTLLLFHHRLHAGERERHPAQRVPRRVADLPVRPHMGAGVCGARAHRGREREPDGIPYAREPRHPRGIGLRQRIPHRQTGRPALPRKDHAPRGNAPGRNPHHAGHRVHGQPLPGSGRRLEPASVHRKRLVRGHDQQRRQRVRAVRQEGDVRVLGADAKQVMGVTGGAVHVAVPGHHPPGTTPGGHVRMGAQIPPVRRRAERRAHGDRFADPRA